MSINISRALFIKPSKFLGTTCDNIEMVFHCFRTVRLTQTQGPPHVSGWFIQLISETGKETKGVRGKTKGNKRWPSLGRNGVSVRAKIELK